MEFTRFKFKALMFMPNPLALSDMTPSDSTKPIIRIFLSFNSIGLFKILLCDQTLLLNSNFLLMKVVTQKHGLQLQGLYYF